MRFRENLGRNPRSVVAGLAAVLAAALLIPTGCETKTEAERRLARMGKAGGGTKAPSGGDSTGGGASEPEASTGPTEKFGTASIKGKVTVSGLPAPSSLMAQVASKPNCVKARGAASLPDLVNETFLTGASGGFKDCVVYIEKMPGRYSVADAVQYGHPQPVVLDQVGCQYVPHVVAAMVGQDLLIKNSDPFLHNVMVPGTTENFSMNTIGEELKSSYFKKKGSTAGFACSVHPWMNAKTFALDHPFFAKTDAEGKFEIKNLPAGTYKVRVWHEPVPGLKKFKTQTITIADGEAKDSVDFASGI